MPDILVIDEAQDMTYFYYDFIQKFTNDINKPDIPLIILGDDMQAIYQFKGSEDKYLINP